MLPLNGGPTVSTLILCIGLQLTTGEASVKPYPCKVGRPIAFRNSPIVDQCMVYGDGKNYLVALIVPNKEFIKQKELFPEVINNVNKNLTLIEKVKKFYIIEENFTIENGLLTPTMKIKRSKVIAKYKNILESFYKN